MQPPQECLLTEALRGEITGTCDSHIASETDNEKIQILKIVQLWCQEHQAKYIVSNTSFPLKTWLCLGLGGLSTFAATQLPQILQWAL